jgi:hypothetical protein
MEHIDEVHQTLVDAEPVGIGDAVARERGRKG